MGNGASSCFPCCKRKRRQSRSVNVSPVVTSEPKVIQRPFDPSPVTLTEDRIKLRPQEEAHGEYLHELWQLERRGDDAMVKSILIDI